MVERSQRRRSTTIIIEHEANKHERKTMKSKLTTGLLALVAAGGLYAHGDAEHVIGFVRTITATSVIVETGKHEMVTVMLRPDTEAMKSQMKAKVGDLKAGDRVVIHAEKNKAGKLEAEEIEWGAAPAKK